MRTRRRIRISQPGRANKTPPDPNRCTKRARQREGMEGVLSYEPGRPVLLAVLFGGEADAFAEEPAKGAETLEADGVADVGHGHVRANQQAARALDSPPREVLMRRLVVDLLEEPEEVMRREPRLRRDSPEVERLLQVRLHKV